MTPPVSPQSRSDDETSGSPATHRRTPSLPVDPMLPRPFRVRSRRRETRDTFTLVLEPADSRPAPRFVPGQFHMLYAFGCGEAAISLSGDPHDTDRVVHTIRAVGTVTKALTRLRPGDTVGLRGPFGRGWPLGPQDDYDSSVAANSPKGHRDSPRDLLVVAGGIGLAPLRPAILSVLRHRSQFRHVALLAGARSPAERLYPSQMETWARSGDIQVESVDHHAGPDWTGNVGVVTSRIPKARFVPAETTALVCGPEVMMRVTASALRRAGVPAERIFLTMERNMRCAAVQCGHCQFGPHFVCHDGPVFALPEIERWMGIPEA
jgi:NAD(P)H-flavin reductase